MRERWPALKSALRAALPRCDCGSVDTARLQSLVAADSRSKAAPGVSLWATDLTNVGQECLPEREPTLSKPW